LTTKHRGRKLFSRLATVTERRCQMAQLLRPQHLSELVKLYVSRNKRIESSTVYMTKLAFGYLIEAVGSLNITEFDRNMAEEYQSTLIDRGLSKISANAYCKMVSPVFSWAVGHKWIEKNPFTGLKKFKVTPTEVRFYRQDELQRLLKVADSLWTGRILMGLMMRTGEVLNTTVGDVDFEQGFVQVSAKKDSAYTWRFEPKDHDRRILPLFPDLATVLLRRLDELPQGHPYLWLTKERYSYLMTHKDKLSDRMKKRPDNNFDRNWKALASRAFVNGSFGMLRKTGLTILSGDLPLQEVQTFGGHSSIETTRRYLGVRRDVLTRAGDLLSRGVAQFG